MMIIIILFIKLILYQKVASTMENFRFIEVKI